MTLKLSCTCCLGSREARFQSPLPVTSRPATSGKPYSRSSGISEATKLPFASRTIFADAFCCAVGKKRCRESFVTTHVPVISFLSTARLQPNIPIRNNMAIDRSLLINRPFIACSRSPCQPGSRGNRRPQDKPTGGPLFARATSVTSALGVKLKNRCQGPRTAFRGPPPRRGLGRRSILDSRRAAHLSAGVPCPDAARAHFASGRRPIYHSSAATDDTHCLLRCYDLLAFIRIRQQITASGQGRHQAIHNSNSQDAPGSAKTLISARIGYPLIGGLDGFVGSCNYLLKTCYSHGGAS